MKKDIITMLQDDGTTKDMELVLLYYDDVNKINYVLYKEIDGQDECYAAKCKIKNDVFEMDTNLSEMEINKLQMLLNTSLKENG